MISLLEGSAERDYMRHSARNVILALLKRVGCQVLCSTGRLLCQHVSLRLNMLVMLSSLFRNAFVRRSLAVASVLVGAQV